MRAPSEVRSQGKIDPVLCGKYRLPLVQKFLALRAAGRTWPKAAAAVGQSPATMHRWVKAYRAQGEAGLRPRYKAAPGMVPLSALIPPTMLRKLRERVAKQVLATWAKFVPVGVAARARKSAALQAAVHAWLAMAFNPKLPPRIRLCLLRGVVAKSLIKAVL